MNMYFKEIKNIDEHLAKLEFIFVNRSNGIEYPVTIEERDGDLAILACDYPLPTLDRERCLNEIRNNVKLNQAMLELVIKKAITNNYYRHLLQALYKREIR